MLYIDLICNADYDIRACQVNFAAVCSFWEIIFLIQVIMFFNQIYRRIFLWKLFNLDIIFNSLENHVHDN